MYLFKNLPISYKLFIGFLLIWIIFFVYVMYLLSASKTFYQSLSQLDTHSDKRVLYSTLNLETIQLSNAVKSYMLTRDPRWEKVYDTTSSQLQTNLTTLATISTSDREETDQVTQFKLTLTELQGTELLILAKTKEGDRTGALKLFDTYYTKRQENLTSLSNTLLNNENNDFDVTLTNLTTTLSQGKLFLGETLAVMLLLIILIGYYFSALIEKSMNKLLISVQKIAAGDLSTRAKIDSNDEIGKLAFAFNRMAEQLQQSYQNLEEKVIEKTKALSETVAILGQEKTKDEAILESIGDGMIVTDEKGMILLINKTAQTMFAINEKSHYGASVYNLFQLHHTDGAPVIMQKRPYSLAISTGKKVTETYSFGEKDQKKIAINITATPVIEKGGIIGVVEIIRDITKEKEIDRMKTEFISLASHQLRTPLSAIRWFSEMLIGGDAGELTSEQQDFAQNIYDSTKRMIELVNSLLNISRIESGRIMIDPKPTDLKELVDSIVKELRVKIDQRQQNLVISVHSDLPKINLDPKLIRQVYMNLLTNSIKYTPKGGDISVFISKKDDQIISQVTDNGYGIPIAEQPKLFQKFFRAINVIKVETDGTGLGLYLIKAIIESSRGKIWYESEENKGTTFWFSLPMTGMEAKKGEVTLDE